jgi:DHA1 family multidrug resistance protein-like MFS transporter
MGADVRARAATRRPILAARLVVLVTFLDLFIQFPVVAPYAGALGASPVLAGVIVGIYSATNLVGNVLAGLWLDRWGRRRPVLIGLLVSAAALGAYALARTPEHLLVARAVHGLATAVLTPGAFAIIGDSAAVDRRARVMGVSGALIAVAAIVGPPLAGITRDRIGPEAVFAGGAVLMLLVAAVFGPLTPATDGPRRPAAPPAAPDGRRLLTNRRLAGACLAALALTVGLGTLVTHLPQALAARGETATRSGLAFTIYALVAMVVMAGPLNRLSDRVDRFGPVAVGLALVGAGMTLLGLVGGAAGVAAGMGVVGLGFGLLFPAATALVAESSSRAQRGLAFGLFYAVYSLGVVAGALLSGLIGQWSGLASGVPFLWGAAVALVAVPAVLLVGRRAGAPARDL